MSKVLENAHPHFHWKFVSSSKTQAYGFRDDGHCPTATKGDSG
jgi:hypothetical protein